MKSTRIPRINRGIPFKILINGEWVQAYEGETIATVMLAEGIHVFYQNSGGYQPSRLYCGMGICQQCLVTVNDESNCQACKTLAKPGMVIKTSS